MVRRFVFKPYLRFHNYLNIVILLNIERGIQISNNVLVTINLINKMKLFVQGKIYIGDESRFEIVMDCGSATGTEPCFYGVRLREAQKFEF